MKKYYKVVYVGSCSSVKNKLYSIVTGFNEGQVEYKVDEWVRAQKPNRKKGYHLLLFKTVEAARACAHDHWWLGDLYECKARGIIKKIPPMLSITIGPELAVSSSDWPTGTTMARKVKLIKRINRFPRRLE